ncbi:serine/arginine repetitive matrix protein 1-like [Medicago truncatula]|uniref:serine/arginine repetitive matrix protein 1-like n=1 Tax=Medicago truncatula TaxID=3880 RepID=UPI000236618E|nr:serine/arginine repetitive matrix protein 1-like [Medicago truncatula]
MAVNGDAPLLQSLVQRPNHDGQTTSPSPSHSLRRGTTATSAHLAVPTQDQPLFDPLRPEEMDDKSTESQIGLLLRMVKNQITLAEEQSRRISELGQSKRQLIHIRETPSPLRNRRGRSPRRSRSRSPRRSVITRSPSRGRRSTRRRSPRRSPPRRSPTRRSPQAPTTNMITEVDTPTTPSLATSERLQSPMD